MSAGIALRGSARILRDLLIIVAAALLISFLMKTYIVRAFYIPSSSMEPTLVIDDRILVNELVPDLVPVSRGDVVVFSDPGGWLPALPSPSGFDSALSFLGLAPASTDNHLIKRVIGLGGDTVVCCDPFGHLEVNGVPLEETYIKLPATAVNATPYDFSVTVPAGALWMMGDNRYNSGDSVKHRGEPSGGFVPLSHVVGTAFVITSPVSRWAMLGNYPDVFHGTEGRQAE